MLEIWKIIRYPGVKQKYQISNMGRKRLIVDPTIISEPEYESSNGYDFTLLETIDGNVRLFPIDEVIAFTFIDVDPKMFNRPMQLIHKDGDSRNNLLDNLEWIPFVERWTTLTCPVYTRHGTIVDVDKGRYIISNTGVVYDRYDHRFLKYRLDDNYYKINLHYEDRKRRNAKLHRILMISFNIKGRSEHRNFVNHINGITTDFSLKNMEWCSNQENVRHAFYTKLETNPMGEKHPRAKFTDNQRECIYEIIKTLKDIQPSHTTGLIRRRLPRITRDDIKYAKKLISNNENFVFPDLSYTWKDPQNFTEEEYQNLERIVDNIFDKYGICGVQEYYTEYEINRIGGDCNEEV